MAEVDFYFDPGCPWAWLATVRLQEAAMRCSARIQWRPVLALRVDAGSGTTVLAAAERAYQAQDLADWAHFCGVSIRRTERLPSAVAARVIAAAADLGGRTGRLVESIFAAGPGGAADINDRDVLLDLAREAGFDVAALSLALDDPRSQAAVEANSAALIAQGGFGSATMVVAGRHYCGNTRLPLVELALTRAGDSPLIIPGAHGHT